MDIFNRFIFKENDIVKYYDDDSKEYRIEYIDWAHRSFGLIPRFKREYSYEDIDHNDLDDLNKLTIADNKIRLERIKEAGIGSARDCINEYGRLEAMTMIMHMMKTLTDNRAAGFPVCSEEVEQAFREGLIQEAVLIKNRR